MTVYLALFLVETYRIPSLIDKGGLGMFYKAQPISNNREVASMGKVHRNIVGLKPAIGTITTETRLTAQRSAFVLSTWGLDSSKWQNSPQLHWVQLSIPIRYY